MAGINHLIIGIRNNAHSGNGACKIVDFGNFFLENAASYKYLYFIESFSLCFVNRCGLVQNLMNDFNNEFVRLHASLWKILSQ